MKTLAIRLEDEQHARLVLLTKLGGVSLTDAIRTAIENHIATLAANTDKSKAESALADIEREAQEQRAALAALFGEAPDDKTPPTTGRSGSRTKG
jgi:hypothetical protein